MKRPESHNIDTEAIRIFEGSLPPDWVVRPQSDDYGIDRELEIFHKGKSTGIICKLQIKGTRTPKLVNNDNSIKHPIKLSSAIYFCRELFIPVFVIAVHVTTRRIWWHPPQLDQDLQRRILEAETAGHKTIAVYLPTINNLDDTRDSFLRAYCDCTLFLSSRAIIQTPTLEFSRQVVINLPADQVAQDFLDKSHAIRLQKLEKLFKAGDIAAADDIVHILRDSTEASLETRFHAWLYQEKIWNRVVLDQPRDDIDNANKFITIAFAVALALRDITRGGPRELKCFASIARLSAKLHHWVHQDYGLFLVSELNKDETDPLILFGILAERLKARSKVVRIYNHCCRYLQIYLRLKGYQGFPQAALRIVHAMTPFRYRLDFEGLTDQSLAYQKSMLQLLDCAAQVSQECKMWGDIVAIAMAGLLIANPKKQDEHDKLEHWARDQISRIKVDTIRNQGLSELNEFCSKTTALFDPIASGIDNATAERQIYKNMAEALGVDLDDPNDRLAMVVRQGITDINPERVLRNCEHLFVSLGPTGLPAKWLKLPTAGFKRIHCTLHGHCLQGFSLDSTYTLFKDTFCNSCNDCRKHPTEWKWTRDWQLAQNEKHREVVERLKRGNNNQA